jgi:SSS family solute:Na+ symporter
LAAAIHHGLTLPAGAEAGVKGGWLSHFGAPIVHTYRSDMAANFWMAIWAWSVCFVMTIVVSLVTKPRDERDLVGLVYSLTDRHKDAEGAWYGRPAVLGVIVLLMTAALNFIFW